MKRIFLFVCLFALTACGGSDEVQSSSAAEDLIGEWRNVSLRIEMNGATGSPDSLKVFEVQESEWESRMNIRPIRTFFKAGGTYNSLHLNLRDSVVYNPAGRWELRGDSLVMTDTFPQRGLKYTYHLKINGNIAEFRGIEDSDGDGQKDDLYFGTQRRQP